MLFVTFPYMFLKYKSRTIPIRDVRAHFRFISFLCSAVFRVLFSGQSRRLRQTNSKPNERTKELCQLPVLLIVICCKCTCLSHTRTGCKENILVCTLKCFEACFGFDLSCATLRMRNFNYVQQLSSSCSSTYGRLIWSTVRFAYYASKLSGCCRSCVQRGVWAMCNRRAIARDNATEREWEKGSKAERGGDCYSSQHTVTFYLPFIDNLPHMRYQSLPRPVHVACRM